MRNKYVSFRFEAVRNNKINYLINHIKRYGKQPDYIDLDKSNLNYTLYGEKYIDIKSIKKEQQSRSKRKIQKNTDRFISGIMTFSNTMREDYESNPELFNKCAIDFLKKFEESTDIKILNAEVHLDEFNPHIHLLIDNIDSKGKAKRRTFKREDLKDFQTYMGNAFKSMGYNRGLPVEETQAKHLSVKQLHILADLFEQINRNKEELTELSTLIELHKENNPSVLLLLKTLENKGVIDIRTNSEDREAITNIKQRIKQKQTLSPTINPKKKR